MRASRSALVVLATSLVIAAIVACTDGVQPDNDSAVATVELTPAQGTVTVGAKAAFAMVLKDALGAALDPARFRVDWSTSSASIAIVASTGLATAEVLGVAPGDATVSVVVAGKSSTGRVTVTAASPSLAPVASVVVTPTSGAVNVTKVLQLSAVAKSAAGTALQDRAITWSSSNSSAATVSSSGLVSGVAPGSTTISATSEGKTGTSGITVTAMPVATVTVTPASPTIAQGSTAQLTATARDAGGNLLPGRSFSWSTSASGVATVSTTGVVTGIAGGSATITATTEGKSGTTIVSVSAAPVPVATVSVTPATAAVQVGSTTQLAAETKDADGATLTGRTVTWTSSATGIATVTNAGVVRGVAAGTATITATSEGKSGSATITVTAVPGGSFVLVGAGDIANCGRSTDELTANLLDTIPGIVFLAGDNAYQNGTTDDYNNCYHPTWGRQKARTRPTPGNHEYNTAEAQGYFDYFNGVGNASGPAGERGKGYYSYDLGAWHIVAINSEIDVSTTSQQLAWLTADLAASTKQCTLAYWHKPLFTSGVRSRFTNMQPIWQALQDAGAEVVVSGHDHHYERFAPQTATGVADPVRGIRMFIAGMGGSGLYDLGTPVANSEVRNNTTYGVIKFTLSTGSYTWEFVPVAGSTFTDSGSGSCH